MRFGLFLILLLLLAGCIHSQPKPEIHVGVLSYRGVEKALSRWTPTIKLLQQGLPSHTLVLVPLNLEQIKRAITHHELEFILTNTGNYFELKSYGLTPISSLKNKMQGKTYSEFGAVIFTHKENENISTLKDLKGKSFAAVSQDAFGGFQMAWRECLINDIEPFKDFSKIVFTKFPQDKVVWSVLSQSVEVGTVRTGLLEAMEDEGLINANNFKVINQQTIEGFPFRLSTQLYPEWPFLAADHTPIAITNKIHQLLLEIEPDSEAAVSGKYTGWSDADEIKQLFKLNLEELLNLKLKSPKGEQLRYQSIDELMRDLKLGPYKADSQKI